MKVPAVAIAVAFVCGIALGPSSEFVRLSTSHYFLTAVFAAASVAFLAGLLFVRLDRLACGVAASLFSWTALGVLSVLIAQQPLPSNRVAALVDNGQLDLHTPLHWYGVLRDEPARLPLGYGYEIELTGVDDQGAMLPLRGGMRLSFSPCRRICGRAASRKLTSWR